MDAKPGPGSGLARAIEGGGFVITAEITPPVSGGPDELIALAEPFRGLVDGINVTDGPRAMVHMSGLAAASILAADGHEPIMQFTCRDRNRIALQADLLGAAALGVRNVMILRGDEPETDETPAPKAVFDVDSRELIELAATMCGTGKLASGRDIATAPDLFIGAADMPVDPKPDWQPTSLAAKADAGARFAQTQFCFDVGIVRRYAARLGEAGLTDRLALLIGLAPLASARSARWMRENLFGVVIPDEIVERMDQAEDQRAEGVKVCAELMQQLSEIPGVAGAHLMAPVGLSGIPLAIKESRLR